MTSTRPLRCTSGKDTWTGHGPRYASDTWTRTLACRAGDTWTRRALRGCHL